MSKTLMHQSPYILGILAVLIALSLSMPAQADTIITLQAATGTDLSNVHVGDTISFDVIGSSTDAGEHLTVFPDVHIFWSSFDMQLTSFFDLGSALNPLTTDPILAVATFLAVNPSTQEVFIGWPDCVGLPGNTSGCAVTNLGATRPADSNHIDFTIQAPEPSSLLLLSIGLVALALWGAFGPKAVRVVTEH